MTGIVIGIHVVVCLALIIIVLLQAGKGADMGAAFGGASRTVFGPRGAAGPLAKITVGAAVIFMLTSLFLTWSSKQSQSSGLMNQTPAPATQPTAPTAPTEPAPSGQGTRTITIPVGNQGGDVTIPGGQPALPSAPASPAPAVPAAPVPAPVAPIAPVAPQPPASSVPPGPP